MSSMTFDWDDRYLVGHGAIDATHREFADLLDALLGADDDGLAAALGAVERHAVDHFALEEQLMERHAFPARECHADEHGRVLASMREVSELLAQGEHAVARDLAAALADWFPGHCDYMDSALAIWVVKKTMQGAPVVLRRMKPADDRADPTPLAA